VMAVVVPKVGVVEVETEKATVVAGENLTSQYKLQRGRPCSLARLDHNSLQRNTHSLAPHVDL